MFVLWKNALSQKTDKAYVQGCLCQKVHVAISPDTFLHLWLQSAGR